MNGSGERAVALLFGEKKPKSAPAPAEDEATETDTAEQESVEFETAFDELVDALGLPRPKDKSAAIEALKSFCTLCREE